MMFDIGRLERIIDTSWNDTFAFAGNKSQYYGYTCIELSFLVSVWMTTECEGELWGSAQAKTI